MNNNDLTVAICMYNAEKYIEETLQCIINQTFNDFKLIILNDCSTDKSVELVETFFKKHPRQYEIIEQDENRGLSAGRRYIEEYAETKYLLFIDADDCPHPDFVESLYSKICSDPDLMAVGCYLEYMNLNGQKVKGGIFIGETTKKGFYEKAKHEKLIFMASTSIYDREIALSVGGHNVDGFPIGKPRYQDLCEDLDLWTRMSDLYKDGKAIIVLPKVLYKYRKGDGMSTDSIGMILRMRHIKTNLKRRRRGEKELSFIEFRETLPVDVFEKLKKDAKAADALRICYYCFKKGKIFRSIKYFAVSITNKPTYLIDKVKHNLLRIK